MSMRFGITRELPFDVPETVSERKRASAARSLEAAMALGAKLFRETGADEDAAQLALLAAAHERITGSKVASLKILADPNAGKSAQLAAVAFKSLAFLDG